MAAATVNTAVVALLAVAAASCLFAADPPLRRETAEDDATAVAEAVDATTVDARQRMAGRDGERETEEEAEAGARRRGVTGDPASWIPEEAEGKRLRPDWTEKMQSDDSDSDSESDSDSDSDSDSQSDSDFESDSDSGSDSDDERGEKGKKVNAAVQEKEERRRVPRA